MDSFTVYSKMECKYCDYAKELLKEEGYSYEIIMCDYYLKEEPEGFLRTMEVKIGYRYNTFPMIFHKEKFIGGYTELVKYLEKIECF